MSSRASRASGPSSCFEDEAAGQGATRIAGIDEAGRGPLAGPVVAAAVILGRSAPVGGLNDSKLLTATRREELYEEILREASAVGVGIVAPKIIDEINILQATRRAMTEAVGRIEPPPDYLLIDGPVTLNIPIDQRPVIKGDRLSLSIAAASIVAKVTRDRIMMELHRQFPQYGFDRHKGYPTADHRAAILRHGPCPAHRMCFRGVKDPEQLPLLLNSDVS